jgi:DNA repair exonuclease SbcCD nuclease subunit
LKFVHTADTHLGFDITKIPQQDPEGRSNRSACIFHNFEMTVQHAITIEADLFIHSGDLFNKYYIPSNVLYELTSPISRLSQKGIKVLLIPGNHERSEFPFELFHGASNVIVFDCPKSVSLELRGYAVGIAGFPFIRENSKRLFHEALAETEYQHLRSDFNMLITHQAFEGAKVGPVDFTFGARRSDTVSRHTIPHDFDYVAAGHIHRYQILQHPFKPELQLVYPGSTQRMSFAEMYEDKYFVEGEVLNNRIETRPIPLPVYDMEIVEIMAAGMTGSECERAITDQYWRFNKELVIRFNLTGGSKARDYPDVDFNKIRSMAPPILECQFNLKVGNRWVQR